MSTLAMNQVLVGDCLPVMQGMATGSVSLTVTSSPYEDARLYRPLEFKLRGQEWVDFMVPRIIEACRVTDGLVLLNAAGKVRDFKYSPVVEWLVTDLTRLHGIVCGPAPYVFHRIGIPGSGGPHYHRRDWEPVYAFARPECLPPKWSDNTTMGHPPKWAPGGEMSNRLTDGTRVNGRDQWGGTGHASSGEGRKANGEHKTRRSKAEKLALGAKRHTKHDAEAEMREQAYLPPTMANPGNTISHIYTADEVAELLDEASDVTHHLVGGGVMGDRCAHGNEAPFPERLCEFFIRSYAPEGGIVLDPFCGSGTVCKVAEKWGRKFIGIDARESQVMLTRKRLLEHGQPLFPDAEPTTGR